MYKITDLDLKGKRVLIRVDFNVPLNGGIVADDFRIRASLPTIKHCLNEGASVVLMSHLGRPKGEVVPALSLDPVAFCLEDLLEREVMFSEDCISDDAIGLSQQMLPREVHLLENLRFYPGEINNDSESHADDILIMDLDFGSIRVPNRASTKILLWYVFWLLGMLQFSNNGLGSALLEQFSPTRVHLRV